MARVPDGGPLRLGLTLDDRLSAARAARDDLAVAGVHLLPIRHHSPACAAAPARLIDEVRPAAILIEGPLHYDALLSDLQHPDTTPPVAVLTVRATDEGRTSSLFPLAEFSPEWVALRAGADLGIPTAFIDLDQPSRPELSRDEVVLQSERYLEQSRTIGELAARLGCRDHDELWDHLFELRGDEPATRLFDDVFAWSALARLDYEAEVLESEGSLRREACMLAELRSWRARVDGPIVVVTGAFHTLPLVEELADLPGRTPLPEHPDSDPVSPDDSWLVPITASTLDGLRGYSAGMPAPSFWLRDWRARTAGTQADVAAGFILDVVAKANASSTDPPISFASTQEAVLQAQRLARLREHPWPSRMDVVDAISSCLVDEAVTPSLRDAVAELFADPTPGTVRRDGRTPPIVRETRAEASRLRFVIDDFASHSTSLDISRSESARTRSRFLHLLAFVGVPFATRASVPDLVSGMGASFLTERWDYQWSPAVEASLVSLMPRAATLHDAGAAVVRERLDALGGNARESSPVTDLLVTVALAGLTSEERPLLDAVDDLIESDPSIPSVLASATRLLGLWLARSRVRFAEPERLGPLVDRALAQAAYLLPDLADVPRDAELEAVSQVVAARRLLRDLDAAEAVDATALSEGLAMLRAPGTAPAVRGAALAVAAADGHLNEDDLAAELRAHFVAGAEPGTAARLLTGMLRAAPELLVRSHELFLAADEALQLLPADVFLDVLPELRHGFTWLKPLETSTVASKVAALVGGDASAIDAPIVVTTADLGQGMAVEAQLVALLAERRLSEWIGS